MLDITEADRAAARKLREVLADISGFWHRIDDDGPLSTALARHRTEAEQRLIGKLTPLGSSAERQRSNTEEHKAGPRIHAVSDLAHVFQTDANFPKPGR